MKVYLITTTKFSDYQKHLQENLKLLFSKFQFERIIEKDQLSYCQKVKEISEMVAKNRKNHRLIMIDESGILGFIVSAKTKGMIVAQSPDQHSAHMTREHNGALAITFGAKTTTIAMAIETSKAFLSTPFAAGRHMVRIDMLDKLA